MKTDMTKANTRQHKLMAAGLPVAGKGGAVDAPAKPQKAAAPKPPAKKK